MTQIRNQFDKFKMHTTEKDYFTNIIIMERGENSQKGNEEASDMDCKSTVQTSCHVSNADFLIGLFSDIKVSHPASVF